MMKAGDVVSNNPTQGEKDISDFIHDKRVEALEDLWEEVEDFLDDAEDSLERIAEKVESIYELTALKTKAALQHAQVQTHLGKMNAEDALTETKKRLARLKEDLRGVRELAQMDSKAILEKVKTALANLTRQ